MGGHGGGHRGGGRDGAPHGTERPWAQRRAWPGAVPSADRSGNAAGPVPGPADRQVAGRAEGPTSCARCAGALAGPRRGRFVVVPSAKARHRVRAPGRRKACAARRQGHGAAVRPAGPRTGGAAGPRGPSSPPRRPARRPRRCRASHPRRAAPVSGRPSGLAPRAGAPRSPDPGAGVRPLPERSSDVGCPCIRKPVHPHTGTPGHRLTTDALYVGRHRPSTAPEGKSRRPAHRGGNRARDARADEVAALPPSPPVRTPGGTGAG